jgi:hypothetical protein
MTQNQAILKHLKRYGTMTRIQAFSDYGICNLWSRISELKRDGHKIGGHMCRVKTRYGSANVKKYYLVRK